MPRRRARRTGGSPSRWSARISPDCRSTTSSSSSAARSSAKRRRPRTIASMRCRARNRRSRASCASRRRGGRHQARALDAGRRKIRGLRREDCRAARRRDDPARRRIERQGLLGRGGGGERGRRHIEVRGVEGVLGIPRSQAPALTTPTLSQETITRKPFARALMPQGAREAGVSKSLPRACRGEEGAPKPGQRASFEALCLTAKGASG